MFEKNIEHIEFYCIFKLILINTTREVEVRIISSFIMMDSVKPKNHKPLYCIIYPVNQDQCERHDSTKNKFNYNHSKLEQKFLPNLSITLYIL